MGRHNKSRNSIKKMTQIVNNSKPETPTLSIPIKTKYQATIATAAAVEAAVVEDASANSVADSCSSDPRADVFSLTPSFTPVSTSPSHFINPEVFESVTKWSECSEDLEPKDSPRSISSLEELLGHTHTYEEVLNHCRSMPQPETEETYVFKPTYVELADGSSIYADRLVIKKSHIQFFNKVHSGDVSNLDVNEFSKKFGWPVSWSDWIKEDTRVRYAIRLPVAVGALTEDVMVRFNIDIWKNQFARDTFKFSYDYNDSFWLEDVWIDQSNKYVDRKSLTKCNHNQIRQRWPDMKIAYSEKITINGPDSDDDTYRNSLAYLMAALDLVSDKNYEITGGIKKTIIARGRSEITNPAERQNWIAFTIYFIGNVDELIRDIGDFATPEILFNFGNTEAYGKIMKRVLDLTSASNKQRNSRRSDTRKYK